MRFLIGMLIGGGLTWAASLAIMDNLPSPGPAFRWLEAQLAPAEVVKEAPKEGIADNTPAPRAMQPLPEPAPVEEAPAPKTPAVVAQSDSIPPARHAEPPHEEEAAEESPPPVVVAPQPSGWESAWVPFQTQRAAAGFAQVLTRQVQHPFEVRREASRRYRVTFAYADDAERERVLAAVRSVTGATP
jgi:hypothetical protein